MRNKKKSIFTAAFLLILFGLPSVVFANVGTPLMWMPGIRLVFLNIVIGIAEGLFISLVFWNIGKKGLGILRCMGIMILANYFSMLFGEWVILNWIGEIRTDILADQPLYNVLDFIRFMVICAFAITIILEYPFCYWALKEKKLRFIKSLVATPLVHIFSYAFLVWAYYSMSTFSIYTKLDVERDMSFAKNKNAWVYYISTEDGDVYRIHPDGTSKELFFDANIKIKDTQYRSSPSLFAWPSKKEPSWDLWLLDDKKTLLFEKFSENTVKPNFCSYGTNEDIETIEEVDYFYSGCVFYSDLTIEKKPEWKLNGGYWAIEGLCAENKKTGELYRVAFEVPFMAWYSYNFNYLDGDQVIYQLGEQIVLLDLNEKKIGLITTGIGPIVTLD